MAKINSWRKESAPLFWTGIKPGRHILVLRCDHLGDAILTTPLLRALAQAGHRVDFVLPQAFMPLFRGNPRLHRCLGVESIVDDWRRQWRGLAGWIRRQRYDVLILPYAKPLPLQLASLFSGVRHRLAMWAGWQGRLTLHRCLRSRLFEEPRPFADILLDCARALDIPPDGLLPEIFFDRPGIVPARLAGRSRIGLHPGSGGNACNLTPSGYAGLAALILRETDWEIVLTGSAGEGRLVEGWDPAILSSPRLRNTLGGLSLPALAEEIEAMDLFVSTGTGPFHMASALGTPTLTPFCVRTPISQRVWGNLRLNGHYLETRPEQCCGVPFGQCCNFSGKISPEALFSFARQVLESPGRSGTGPSSTRG